VSMLQPYRLDHGYIPSHYLGKFVFEEGVANGQGLRDSRFSGVWSLTRAIPFPQLGLRAGCVPDLSVPERLTKEEAARLPKLVSLRRVSESKRLPERLVDFLPSRNSIVSAKLRDAILSLRVRPHKCDSTSTPWQFAGALGG
jgi:hypothetical protein